MDIKVTDIIVFENKDLNTFREKVARVESYDDYSIITTDNYQVEISSSDVVRAIRYRNLSIFAYDLYIKQIWRMTDTDIYKRIF